MPTQVINTAKTLCSFGTVPANFNVLPTNKVMAFNQPAANIMDHKAMVNVMPHGMCISLANPQVAAATAAASGVLTPQPCIPATTSPWVPGATASLIGSQKLLNDTSSLICNWAGNIKIVFPGQVTTITD
jgi:hypothetical protein